MRTIIDLQEQQITALKALGQKTQLSRAELIRRAVNDYLAKMHITESNDVFGLWKEKGWDAIKYQNKIREEWSSDESSF